MRKLTALSRFISKSMDECQPSFKYLRKIIKFEWTKDCYKAFKDLKRYLASLQHTLNSNRETIYSFT